MLASKPRSSYNEHHGGRVREVRGPLAFAGRVREVRVAPAFAGSVRKAQVAACIFRTISKWQLVVIWVPNRIFEKSDRRGEYPAREIRPFAFVSYPKQNKQHHRPRWTATSSQPPQSHKLQVASLPCLPEHGPSPKPRAFERPPPDIVSMC